MRTPGIRMTQTENKHCIVNYKHYLADMIQLSVNIGNAGSQVQKKSWPTAKKFFCLTNQSHYEADSAERKAENDKKTDRR